MFMLHWFHDISYLFDGFHFTKNGTSNLFNLKIALYYLLNKVFVHNRTPINLESKINADSDDVKHGITHLLCCGT
jgi:hypothetical protein